MLRIISKITFTSAKTGEILEFDFCESLQIVSSFEDLTDTAKIKFPRKLSLNGKNIFLGETAKFKRGDKVKIELGYNPKLRTVFEGYINKVGSNIPIEIECEDAMFLLKKNTIKSFVKETVSLKELLTSILPKGIEFEDLGVQLGSFRISNATSAKILDTLKSEYGFYSYFMDGKLHCGLPYNASKTNTAEFAFEENIINQDDLQFQQADDINIKVVAISMQSDNSKKEITVGDADGAQRTFYTYNSTEADLKKFADLKLNEVRYTGYVGSIFTFGEPYMRHGDIAKITSKKLPERNGNYLIKSVTRELSVDVGYKQTLQLGNKA